MIRLSFKAPALALACLLAAPTFATPISYEMVTVSSPRNADNGSVAYSYQIGKYEVTIGQYAAFLNAVAMTDTYRLYNERMATDLNVAGISQAGSSGSYTYSVIDTDYSSTRPTTTSANRPITYVSWFDAARFANWMANGQPTGEQSSTTTENGVYDLTGPWVGRTSGNAVAKNVVIRIRVLPPPSTSQRRTSGTRPPIFRRITVELACRATMITPHRATRLQATRSGVPRIRRTTSLT